MMSIAVVVILAAFSSANAQVSFKKTMWLTTEKSKQKLLQVDLRIFDDKLVLANRKTSVDRLTIPFVSTKSISYEMAKRHRVSEGAALMGVSLGAGAVLMVTKTKSHWMAIQYMDGEQQQTAVLQLHKNEYGPVITALETRSGKKIEILTDKQSRVNPTIGSENVDETLSQPADRVSAALKAAMEKYGCRVTIDKADRLECKRARSPNEATGAGGEKITARLEREGNTTRIRIGTGKGLKGRFGKKNWSTPIFEDAKRRLEEVKA